MHWKELIRRWLVKSVIVCAVAAVVTWPFWRDSGNSVARGTVVDQDDRPISDALLTFEAHEQRMILPVPPYGWNYRSSKTVTCRTNSAGAFAVRSPRKQLDLVSLDKSGYVEGPRHADRRSYTPPRPRWDALYPSQVVRLDDVRAPEPALSVREVVLPLKRGETEPLYVDFETGQWSRGAPGPDGADIAIAREGDVVSARTLGGTSGVWVGNNAFRYAPSHDYAHGVAFQLRKRDAPGQAPTAMLLYARTREPARFSRVKLVVPDHSDNMQISVKLNPTGSRDLRGGPEFTEPDIVGGRSARVELGVHHWWQQCERRTMALHSPEHYPPAAGSDRHDRNREDRYLSPPP